MCGKLFRRKNWEQIRLTGRFLFDAPSWCLLIERSHVMKTTSAVILGIVAVIALGFAMYMVDVDQTEEASLPDVDVTVEGGNLPEFDAEVGSVTVTEETATVPVPDVDVTMEEAEVSVPGLEITPPEDADDEKVAESN
jgi:hypothetical protein